MKSHSVLLLIVAVGLWVRIDHIGARSITHEELYTPGIPLPAGFSEPSPRTTFLATLTGSMWDVHPPTWYLAMYPWTKALGWSEAVMRFPSAVFGTLLIVLIYAIGAIERGRVTGIIAAALVALNGHHVFWSQMARPYMMTCFVGVLSTFLLLRAIQLPSGRRVLSYAGSLLLGLILLYYFWPLALTHILWVAAKSKERQELYALVEAQLCAVILACPVLTLAMFQSRTSYLSADLAYLPNYFQVGFSFEPDLDGPVSMLPSPQVSAVLITVALALFVYGFLHERGLALAALPPSWSVHRRWYWRAALTSVFISAVLTSFFAIKRPQRFGACLVSCTAPILTALVMEILRSRDDVRRFISRVLTPLAVVPLTSTLAIMPVAIVVGVSKFVPLFASRGMLIYTPYLMVTLAAGLGALFAVRKPWSYAVAGSAAMLVLALTIQSLRYNALRPAAFVDYKGLGTYLLPQLHPKDTIYIRPRDWMVTPVFFYTGPNRQYVADDGGVTVLDSSRGPRAWVVRIDGDNRPVDVAPGAQKLKTVTVRRIRAELYDLASASASVR